MSSSPLTLGDFTYGRAIVLVPGIGRVLRIGAHIRLVVQDMDRCGKANFEWGAAYSTTSSIDPAYRTNPELVSGRQFTHLRVTAQELARDLNAALIKIQGVSAELAQRQQALEAVSARIAALEQGTATAAALHAEQAERKEAQERP